MQPNMQRTILPQHITLVCISIPLKPGCPDQGTYKGTPQFSQALPYSGYQPFAPGRSDGGVYTIGATLASGAASAVSSGLHNHNNNRQFTNVNF